MLHRLCIYRALIYLFSRSHAHVAAAVKALRAGERARARTLAVVPFSRTFLPLRAIPVVRTRTSSRRAAERNYARVPKTPPSIIQDSVERGSSTTATARIHSTFVGASRRRRCRRRRRQRRRLLRLLRRRRTTRPFKRSLSIPGR